MKKKTDKEKGIASMTDIADGMRKYLVKKKQRETAFKKCPTCKGTGYVKEEE